MLVRSFARVQAASPGFDADRLMGVVMQRPQLPEGDTSRARAAFSNAVLEKVRALPGVLSAASISFHPMGGNNWNNGFVIEVERSGVVAPGFVERSLEMDGGGVE